MLRIRNGHFYLTRGDSCAIKFVAKIPLYESDRAVLQITTPITPEGAYEVILEAVIPPDLEENAFVISFFPEDTAQWKEGVYLWTLTVYQDPVYDEEGMIITAKGVYTTNLNKSLMHITGGKKNGNLE